MNDDDETAPYLKMLTEIRVGWEEEILILPPGRCLIIQDSDEDGIFVELEQEGAGYLYFKYEDERVSRATWTDVETEPEQDGMEYRDNVPAIYTRRTYDHATD